MYHGIIKVYKEAGYTSHDVVAKLRGICKQKKIGHTGTLDPDAVGVLPVCLGNGTKLCDMLTDRQKEYVAVFRLGITTDTQDGSGKILEEKEVKVSADEVKKVILSFQGNSLQIPPMYSALKVNGKKLYELARQGKEVVREARPITVYAIEILEESHPEYTIRVECSKGTYIRTLCHDIGQALGCGAVMTKLTRSRVGEFRIEEAHRLEDIQKLAEEGRLARIVVPVEKMFETLPKLKVKKEWDNALKNGNQMKKSEFMEIAGNTDRMPEPADGEEFRVYSYEDVFFGIYQYEQKRKLFCPVKLFITT